MDDQATKKAKSPAVVPTAAKSVPVKREHQNPNSSDRPASKANTGSFIKIKAENIRTSTPLSAPPPKPTTMVKKEPSVAPSKAPEAVAKSCAGLTPPPAKATATAALPEVAEAADKNILTDTAAKPVATPSRAFVAAPKATPTTAPVPKQSLPGGQDGASTKQAAEPAKVEHAKAASQGQPSTEALALEQALDKELEMEAEPSEADASNKSKQEEQPHQEAEPKPAPPAPTAATTEQPKATPPAPETATTKATPPAPTAATTVQPKATPPAPKAATTEQPKATPPAPETATTKATPPAPTAATTVQPKATPPAPKAATTVQPKATPPAPKAATANQHTYPAAQPAHAKTILKQVGVAGDAKACHSIFCGNFFDQLLYKHII